MVREKEMKLSKILIYPVKSMAGYEVSSSGCTQNGLQGDRSFVVARPDGRFLTARQLPKLLTLRPVWNDSLTEITIKDTDDSITVAVPDGGAETEVQIWKDTAVGYDCGEQVAGWLSERLGKDVRLISMARKAVRTSASNAHAPSSFADAMPLLVMSQESIDLINSNLEVPVSWENFRPNLVVSGLEEPFGEDSWHRAQVGSAVLQMAHGCTRCVMTTVDQLAGTFRKDGEPMHLLKAIRRAEDKQVYVGQNAIVLSAASLRVGDPVTVQSIRQGNLLAPKP